MVAHLKNPGMYTSVSAFAPIANPVAVPWGEKAFTGYLGSVEAGKAYDSTELVKNYSGPKPCILIDQGTADGFPTSTALGSCWRRPGSSSWRTRRPSGSRISVRSHRPGSSP